MLNLKNKSIIQVLFIVNYVRDLAIRTKQFDIEKVLVPLITTPSFNTNLPDDFNPQAPRVIFQQNHMSIHFSQLAAQFTIDIDHTNDMSLEIIQEKIAKEINWFQNCVNKIVPHKQQRERGLVLTMSYPIDSALFSDEIIFDYIQSHFFKIHPFGKPAGAQFNVGYRTEDNFFITLTVAQYQIIAGKMPNLPVDQWIDMTTLPIKESGIELKIDVNSRPLLNTATQPLDITEVLLKKAFDFAIYKSDKFMGI
jgi:hypothetical protein